LQSNRRIASLPNSNTNAHGPASCFARRCRLREIVSDTVASDAEVDEELDTREVVKRFERERQILALVDHPNIAQVFEAGATSLGHFPGVELFDRTFFPECVLSAGDSRLLAEIEAAAEVHPGGDLVPLSSEAWLERWQRFRRKHPHFADHAM